VGLHRHAKQPTLAILHFEGSNGYGLAYEELAKVARRVVVAHPGYITKAGPALVRRARNQAAWQAKAHSPRVCAFFERVGAGDPDHGKIAIVATTNYLVPVAGTCEETGQGVAGCAEPSVSRGSPTLTGGTLRDAAGERRGLVLVLRKTGNRSRRSAFGPPARPRPGPVRV